MQGFIIFTDLAKYSKLEDKDLKIYYDKVVPVVYDRLKTYKAGSLVWNTWGDAIVAAFKDSYSAVKMTLEYREIFRELDFTSLGMKNIIPRIAGHFGKFEVLFDKVSGKINVLGTDVNLAARIEPITTPGEIFVSQSFKNQIPKGSLDIEIRFDDMGIVKLPKESGQINAYRLCKNNEPEMAPVGKKIPDSVCTKNLESQKPNIAHKRSGFKR